MVKPCPEDVDSANATTLENWLNPRQIAFARYYAEIGNATKAAEFAGYSAKGAAKQGHLLSRLSIVQRLVGLYREERMKAIGLDRNTLLGRWADIAMSDPTEVVRLARGCCRYCYGADGEYQWRSPREFRQAVLAFEAKDETWRAIHLHERPDDIGGFGFDPFEKPRAGCLECAGRGVVFLDIPATDEMPPEVRARVVSATQDSKGISVKLMGPEKALEQLAKLLGYYAQPDAGDTANSLHDLLSELSARGSRAPIKSGSS